MGNEARSCLSTLSHCNINIMSERSINHHFIHSHNFVYYLRRHLASRKGIVTLGVTLSRCVCVRHISLGGEGNAQYPLLSRYLCGSWASCNSLSRAPLLPEYETNSNSTSLQSCCDVDLANESNENHISNLCGLKTLRYSVEYSVELRALRRYLTIATNVAASGLRRQRRWRR